MPRMKTRLREGAVEQPQGSGYQGQALCQHVEREPVLVQPVDPDSSRPVFVQPDLRMSATSFPLEYRPTLT
jgi:hypothetical protein